MLKYQFVKATRGGQATMRVGNSHCRLPFGQGITVEVEPECHVRPQVGSYEAHQLTCCHDRIRPEFIMQLLNLSAPATTTMIDNPGIQEFVTDALAPAAPGRAEEVDRGEAYLVPVSGQGIGQLPRSVVVGLLSDPGIVPWQRVSEHQDAGHASPIRTATRRPACRAFVQRRATSG